MVANRDAGASETGIEALYRDRTRRSQALFERSLRSLPGGDTRSQLDHRPYPVFMSDGDGCYLHDADGNVYLDFVNNYTSLIHGHRNDPVIRAVGDQINRGSALGAPTEAQISLAETLSLRIDGVESLRFCNSGTEAVILAVRAARAFTGRTKILRMEGGYHGCSDTMLVSVHSASGTDQADGHSSGADIPMGVAQDIVVTRFNDVAMFERVFQEHRQQLAAVIVEPMLGSGGMVPATDEFLHLLRRATQSADVILILDEILTFRLAWGGLQSRYQLRPDLTTLGKIIGGGLPVGAVGGRSDVMALFDPRRPSFLYHGGTYNGNPLTMAAGLATLDHWRIPDIERLNDLGDSLRQRLAAVMRQLGVAGHVSGLGSLLQVHLDDAPNAESGSPAPRYASACSLLHLALLNRGIATAPRGMFALSTPMTEDHIQTAEKAFGEAMNEVRQTLSNQRAVV